MTGPGRGVGPADTFGEPVAPGLRSVYEGRLVHRERSAFQRIEVYDHQHFGRVLLLDGLVQTTERDEFFYHEMLVHPALLALDSPERVLVVGGGDGGALRRVLEHPVREAVLCEIDEAVTRASLAHLPSVSAGALQDPRASVRFEDGAAFVAGQRLAFDAILVDSTDPLGPATVLFSEAFYASCRQALRPGGLLVAQTGSPVYQLDELCSAAAAMARVFPIVQTYLGSVPTYPGVLWSFTAGTEGEPLSAPSEATLEARLRARGLAPRYYTPALHRAAFALPAFLARALQEARGATPEPAPVPRG